MSLRTILPRHAALVVAFALAFSSRVAAAVPPVHSWRPVLQTITVTPSNGTVLTTSTISPLQVVWCDPTGSMVGHTITWQGQPLAGEIQSRTIRPGCGSPITSSFASVAVDFTKPLTLVASATDRSGQVTTNHDVHDVGEPRTSRGRATHESNDHRSSQRRGIDHIHRHELGDLRASADARAVVRIGPWRGEPGDDHAAVTRHRR